MITVLTESLKGDVIFLITGNDHIESDGVILGELLDHTQVCIGLRMKDGGLRLSLDFLPGDDPGIGEHHCLSDTTVSDIQTLIDSTDRVVTLQRLYDAEKRSLTSSQILLEELAYLIAETLTVAVNIGNTTPDRTQLEVQVELVSNNSSEIICILTYLVNIEKARLLFKEACTET